MKRQVSMIGMIALCVLSFFAASVSAGPNDVVKVGLQYDPATMNMLQMKSQFDLSPVLHMHQALQGTNPFTGERTFTNSLSETVELMPNKKDIKIKSYRRQTTH